MQTEENDLLELFAYLRTAGSDTVSRRRAILYAQRGHHVRISNTEDKKEESKAAAPLQEEKIRAVTLLQVKEWLCLSNLRFIANPAPAPSERPSLASLARISYRDADSRHILARAAFWSLKERRLFDDPTRRVLPAARAPAAFKAYIAAQTVDYMGSAADDRFMRQAYECCYRFAGAPGAEAEVRRDVRQGLMSRFQQFVWMEDYKQVFADEMKGGFERVLNQRRTRHITRDMRKWKRVDDVLERVSKIATQDWVDALKHHDRFSDAEWLLLFTELIVRTVDPDSYFHTHWLRRLDEIDCKAREITCALTEDRPIRVYIPTVVVGMGQCAVLTHNKCVKTDSLLDAIYTWCYWTREQCVCERHARRDPSCQSMLHEHVQLYDLLDQLVALE